MLCGILVENPAEMLKLFSHEQRNTFNNDEGFFDIEEAARTVMSHKIPVIDKDNKDIIIRPVDVANKVVKMTYQELFDYSTRIETLYNKYREIALAKNIISTKDSPTNVIDFNNIVSFFDKLELIKNYNSSIKQTQKKIEEKKKKVMKLVFKYKPINEREEIDRPAKFYVGCLCKGVPLEALPSFDLYGYSLDKDDNKRYWYQNNIALEAYYQLITKQLHLTKANEAINNYLKSDKLFSLKKVYNKKRSYSCPMPAKVSCSKFPKEQFSKAMVGMGKYEIYNSFPNAVNKFTPLLINIGK